MQTFSCAKKRLIRSISVLWQYAHMTILVFIGFVSASNLTSCWFYIVSLNNVRISYRFYQQNVCCLGVIQLDELNWCYETAPHDTQELALLMLKTNGPNQDMHMFRSDFLQVEIHLVWFSYSSVHAVNKFWCQSRQIWIAIHSRHMLLKRMKSQWSKKHFLVAYVYSIRMVVFVY